jgi:hypothetical protein
MTKFAIHYIDANGASRVYVLEAIDPEHARQLFNAKEGKRHITKTKVLRGLHHGPGWPATTWPRPST